VRWVGLDVGTTRVKCVVYDDQTRAVVAQASRRTPVREEDGRAERDPDEVVDVVVALLATALEICGTDAPVGGLSIASMGEEVVFLSREGRPTRPTIAWYDPRGCDDAPSFLASRATALHEVFEPRPEFTLFKLRWVSREEPESIADCRRVLELGGYVLMRLGAEPVMDWSHGCRTGLFDPVATAWDEDSLEAADVPASWWPPLVPSGWRVGMLSPALAERLGLPESPALVSGGHDHFCGAYACDVRDTLEIYVSAGTSEAQIVLTDGPTDPWAEGFPVDRGRFVDETSWYAHVALPTGHAFRQWASLLFPGWEDETIEAAVEVEVSDAAGAGVLFEPGTVSSGSTLHVRPFVVDRGTIMRAVLEGSAVASADASRALTRAVNGEPGRIVVSGRAPQRELWKRLRGGILGRELEVVLAGEATALGAALLAQRGVTGQADREVVPRVRWRPSQEDLAFGRQLVEAYRDLTGRPPDGRRER
jgi:sugar (pentulose or hexulose) kinase